MDPAVERAMDTAELKVDLLMVVAKCGRTYDAPALCQPVGVQEAVDAVRTAEEDTEAAIEEYMSARRETSLRDVDIGVSHAFAEEMERVEAADAAEGAVEDAAEE